MSAPQALVNLLEDLSSQEKISEDLYKLHRKLDTVFEFKNIDIKTELFEVYPGLHSEALNTSYVDFYKILKSIPKDQFLVDLGAGFGRGSLLSCLLGLRNCISVEVVQERYEQTLKALSVFEAEDLAVNLDLVESEIPKADNYYLYFAKSDALYSILRKLFDRPSNLYVCEADGTLIPFIELFMDENSLVNEIPLTMSRHYPSIKVYKLDGKKMQGDLFQNFPYWYLNHFDSDKVLLAEYSGMRSSGKADILLPIKDFDLVTYGKKVGLQHRNSNRRYILDEEIKIHSLIESVLPNELLREMNGGSKAILVDGQITLDRRDGATVKTDYTAQSLSVTTFS